MRRRDFGTLLGGGLRSAVPAPQRNAQEPASSRREGPRSHWQVGCAPPQSNQKKSVTMSDLEERPLRVGVKRTLTLWTISEKSRT
jgi:hypothetical protein